MYPFRNFQLLQLLFTCPAFKAFPQTLLALLWIRRHESAAFNTGNMWKSEWYTARFIQDQICRFGCVRSDYPVLLYLTMNYSLHWKPHSRDVNSKRMLRWSRLYDHFLNRRKLNFTKVAYLNSLHAITNVSMSTVYENMLSVCCIMPGSFVSLNTVLVWKKMAKRFFEALPVNKLPIASFSFLVNKR